MRGGPRPSIAWILICLTGPNGKSTFCPQQPNDNKNSSLSLVYEPAALEMEPPADADHVRWDFGRPNKQTHATHETHNRLTAFVRDNPGRPVPEETLTHSHPTWSSDILFIIFLHLQRSMASSLFILRAWQTSQTTSLQVLFGLPLGLRPSTSYSIHIFTQS